METVKTGTTTLGITCKNAVVIATDRRATAGTMIAHKNVHKVIQVSDHIAMTIAGLAADGQVLARWMRSEFALYSIRNGREISVNAAANFLSNVLNQNKFTPFYVELLMGGFDDNGAHIIDLDAAGGVFEDDFISTGSGSPFAYGLLEQNYKKDMPLKDALRLARDCVKVAMSRDSATGDDIEIVYITKDGFNRLSREEMEKL
jgi:proteasome beta subunit